MRKIPFLALFILCSCAKQLIEYTIPEEHDILEIAGSISQEYLTKVNDGGFANGDKMGVYIVDYQDNTPGNLSASHNHTTNVSLVYNESTYKWTSSNPIYWKDKETHVDVYGYYPYESVIQSVNDYEFSVLADQCQKGTETGMSNYEKSDFLWAKVTDASPADGTIFLNFSHRMAGIKVSLLRGSGFSEAEWAVVSKSVSVDGLARKARIDISTGIVEATGSPDKNIVMAAQPENVFRAVVVPQTVPAGTQLIGITIDGTSYHYAIQEGITLISSKMYSFSLQIDKREGGDYVVSLVSQDISVWENDSLSHAFETTAYTVIHCEHEGSLADCVASIGKNPASILNLKITGRLNSADFDFIRNEMTVLRGLNLYETVTYGNVVPSYVESEVWWSNSELSALSNSTSAMNPEASGILPERALKDMKTIKHLILPRNLKVICREALSGLELAFNSTLIIPNSVLAFGPYALSYMGECSLVLPDSLVIMSDYAMHNQKAHYEIKLPNSLEYIGDFAFLNSIYAYGKLVLPSGLKKLGCHSFQNFGDGIEAILTIPEAISEVEDGVFYYMPMWEPDDSYWAKGIRSCTLKFHDGITKIGPDAFNTYNTYGLMINNYVEWPSRLKQIGDGAFSGVSFLAGVGRLPDSVISIGNRCFSGCNLPANISIPESLSTIPDMMFSGASLQSIEISRGVESIGNGSFYGCHNLEEVVIGKYVEEIGSVAFSDCEKLKNIVCLSANPPKLGDDCFWGCDMDHLVLEVPEKAVGLYKNSVGWKRIKYITAHHELALSLKYIRCLAKGIIRELVVRSEGPWELVECPSWCHLSQESSELRTTEITVSVNPSSESRTGKIVIRLKDKDYLVSCPVEQYIAEAHEDTEIVLQAASSGASPIPIFIVGDGFTADKIADGSYLQHCREQMEDFFAIEPYKSYRDFFTVSTSLAVSPEEGISTVDNRILTRFDSTDDPSGGLRCDVEKLKRYVVDVSGCIDESNVSNSLIMLVLNRDSFSGNTVVELDGTTISLNTLSSEDYPFDTRGLVQYYAGGAGFGRLASEDVFEFAYLKDCDCFAYTSYKSGQARGWYQNVCTSGSISTVPWKHLIFDSRYSDIVDVYEGGFGHLRGVFRSEAASCMNGYIQYYNTFSRELIVRRIMSLSGQPFDFESFVSKDSREGLPQ